MFPLWSTSPSNRSSLSWTAVRESRGQDAQARSRTPVPEPRPHTRGQGVTLGKLPRCPRAIPRAAVYRVRLRRPSTASVYRVRLSPFLLLSPAGCRTTARPCSAGEGLGSLPQLWWDAAPSGHKLCPPMPSQLHLRRPRWTSPGSGALSCAFPGGAPFLVALPVSQWPQTQECPSVSTFCAWTQLERTQASSAGKPRPEGSIFSCLPSVTRCRLSSSMGPFRLG